jgi:phytoene dehydrogenase-like protein
MAADTFEAAAASESVDDMFLRMESAGVMLRIDRQVLPTMARTPTLAEWELELLRSIEHVVRLGRVKYVDARRLVLDDGEVELPADTVVVHCAAAGLRDATAVPIWGDRSIVPQPIRTGFPCFGAALTGYVEATRESVEEKNRLCPSSPYGNSLADWSRMQALGMRAAASSGADADIRTWMNECHLNPARIPAARAEDAAVRAATARVARHAAPALAKLSAYAGLS